MKGIPLRTLLLALLMPFACSSLFAQAPATPVPVVQATETTVPAPAPARSSADFADYARKLRDATIHNLEPKTIVPTLATGPHTGHYPWKTGIVTTVFWVGNATNAKGANTSSAWDPDWEKSFGGFDNPAPKQRREFVSVEFEPKLNPFYIALPYNDVAGKTTKPESRVVIPWFRSAFMEEGKSVCSNRWVAIRNAGGKVCYAQWSDCGPFGSDHWQYVFGSEKPRPNANGGAGLNVSPAVRDFLGLQTSDVTDWRFVDFSEIPQGPWARYGRNNPFVQTPILFAP